MLYVILGTDRENSLESRLAARPAHLDRIQQLVDLGRLVMAGPLPAVDNEDPGEAGFTGSLIVAEFADLAEAEQWADQDHYVQEGVFESVTVKPFKRVLP